MVDEFRLAKIGPRNQQIRKIGPRRRPRGNEGIRTRAREGGRGKVKTSPWALRVRRIRGSERKKVSRIRKKMDRKEE